MKIFEYRQTQKLPISIEKAWEFFSSPKNLKEITPPYMGFDITTQDLNPKMHAGMIISYKVSPLLGIKMTWVTEITHVQEPNFFVDEQRFGPYSLWHHQHHFKEIENGIEMTDIINYKAPLGILGQIVTPFIVTPKLQEIFDHRKKVLLDLFGEYK